MLQKKGKEEAVEGSEISNAGYAIPNKDAQQTISLSCIFVGDCVSGVADFRTLDRFFCPLFQTIRSGSGDAWGKYCGWVFGIPFHFEDDFAACATGQVDC